MVRVPDARLEITGLFVPFLHLVREVMKLDLWYIGRIHESVQHLLVSSNQELKTQPVPSRVSFFGIEWYNHTVDVEGEAPLYVLSALLAVFEILSDV